MSQNKNMLPCGRTMVALIGYVLTFTNVSRGYIDLAPTLAKIITDSKQITLVEVVSYDREKRQVTLRQNRALKGDPVTDVVHHDVAPVDGTTVSRAILQWAAPGARAVMFASRTTALVCIGEGWYQVRSGESGAWKLGPERPDLPLAYYGSLSRLADGVEQIIAGNSAVLTVVAFGADQEGASFDLALNRQALPGLIRVQRIRANLKMPPIIMVSSANPEYFLGAGTVDEADIPRLVQDLKSPDAIVRAEAANDLRSLGKKADAATQDLKLLLDDPTPRVRIWSAAALLRIQPKDQASLEPLGEALESSDAAIRREAAKAAGLSGASISPLAGKLAALLKDADESTRIAALVAISTLGPAVSSAADAVVPLLDDPNMAIDAADALGHIGRAARPALPRLAKMLSSEQSAIRWAAVRAMSQIGGPDAHAAVEFMIQTLPKSTEVEAYNMMIYLSLLGPVAIDALPVVRETPLKNPVLGSATEWAMAPDKNFPWLGGGDGRGFPGGGRGGGRGGRGFGGPGGGPGGAGDAFMLFVYQAYVRELGDRLAPAAKVLAQKIMDGSAGDVPEWGYSILGCGPEEALHVLSPNLSSEDLATRERAAVALGYMGSAAAQVVPKLRAAADKASNEQEKRLLQWAIGEIEKE